MTEMTTHNDGKSVVAERFIRMYSNMTLISKKVCIDKLDDIVNEYNKAYHRTINIKPINVMSSTYIGFGVENND